MTEEKRLNEIIKGILSAVILLGAGYAVLTNNAAASVFTPLATLVVGYWFGVSQPTPGAETVVKLPSLEP